jgi:hypothetical protein
LDCEKPALAMKNITSRKLIDSTFDLFIIVCFNN